MLFLLLHNILHCSAAFPVFTFEGTSQLTGSPSFFTLVKDVRLPDVFILCLSVKQARFDGVSFFSVYGKDSQEWMKMKLQTFSNATKLTIVWDRNFYRLGELQDPRLEYWYHICVRLDLKLSRLEAAVNGELMGQAGDKNITNIPTKLEMRVGVGFENTQFHGSVANIQVFADGSLKDLSGLPCNSWQGAILTWDPKSWKVVGSDCSLTEDFDHVFCNIRDDYSLAITSKITFKESVDICKHKLNNSIIPSQEDRELFLNYIDWHNVTSGGVCPYIWTPFSDEQSEGYFINVNNDTETTLQSWVDIELNGDADENFLEIVVAEKALNDAPENSGNCGSCLISSSLLLKLDGRCRDSLIDKEYKILNSLSSVGFNGWKNMYIRYDRQERMWKMRHARIVDFLATSRAPENSLLLGSHPWLVHNDSVTCSNGGRTSYRTNLTLHACDPDHFACENAFCIPMEQRCDGIEDCIDGSDEQDCGKLIIRPGYKKELTPISRSGQNVSVNFSLNILDIEIFESTEMFITKISFTRDWFDRRLMYKHLKKNSGINMNTLLPAESEAIWFPYVVFNNVRESGHIKETEVLQSDGFEVIPNEKFVYLAEDNMHIFNGSENALRQNRGYTISWKCEYAYHWYPFDKQVCRMEFASLRSYTDFVPDQLKYNPNIYLNCYTLSRVRMCKSFINKVKAIIVEVTLGRPLVSNLLTVFVPTMLLVSITFIARFFADDYIDMVVQVNLTILLVLATIYMGLSQSLPVTSYFKMIDIWMLFTMTVPFAEVVRHTANEVFKQPDFRRVDVMGKEQDVKDTRIRVALSSFKAAGRFALPISSLIFTIAFLTVGLVKSYSPGDTQNLNMVDCLTLDIN